MDSPLDKAKKYFSTPLDINANGQDPATLEEHKALFGGDLDTLDDWLKHEAFRLEKKDKESERDLRRKNANRSFWFSLGWASFIGLFIGVKGFYKDFQFTQTEYLATIGTLSITILTYYLVVVRSIFPNGSKH